MNKLNHQNVTDEDLIMQIAIGDHLAFLELVKRYEIKAFILAKEYVSTYAKDGISIGDIASVASASLMKAMKRFEPDKGLFFSYWKQVAIHEIKDYASRNSYRLGAKAFGGLSLNDSQVENNGQVVLTVGQTEDASSDLLSEDFLKYVEEKGQKANKKLAKTLKMLIYGYSVNEIAKALKISAKTVYYYITTLKKLYRVFITKLY